MATIHNRHHLAGALAAVGDRWTLHLVADLLDGPRRFGELAEALPGIAPNILTARLRHLERAGLVVSTPYSHRPLRLAYILTDTGRELRNVIALLAAWGGRQVNETEGPVHDLCGSPLETRMFCATCERPVDDLDAEPMRWM